MVSNYLKQIELSSYVDDIKQVFSPQRTKGRNLNDEIQKYINGLQPKTTKAIKYQDSDSARRIQRERKELMSQTLIGDNYSNKKTRLAKLYINMMQNELENPQPE